MCRGVEGKERWGGGGGGVEGRENWLRGREGGRGERVEGREKGLRGREKGLRVRGVLRGGMVVRREEGRESRRERMEGERGWWG